MSRLKPAELVLAGLIASTSPHAWAKPARLPLRCAAIASQLSERPSDSVSLAAESRTLFGHLMVAVLGSQSLPREFKDSVVTWCREGRFFYLPDPQAPPTTYDGIGVRDHIVLTARGSPDPLAAALPDAHSCVALASVGTQLFHELTHLTSGSGHGEAKPQEHWTQNWGDCLLYQALAELARSRDRIALCRRAYEKGAARNCRGDLLKTPRGFKPPRWWPAPPSGP